MTAIPKFFVDGILSVATHNGVHRLVFYDLTGSESPRAEPCVEIAVPEMAVRGIVETMTAMAKAAPEAGLGPPAAKDAPSPV